MIRFLKLIYLVALLQFFTRNVLSEKDTNSDVTEDAKSNDPNGRRSGGVFIVENSEKVEGPRLTSHKVETKTYTTRVTSGSSGSGGLRGWVSESHSGGGGDVILQPQIEGIVQTQQACGSANNVLANTGGQASLVQKKTTVTSSQTLNEGGSLGGLTSNDNQWQMNQKGIGSLVVGQLGGQSSVVHGSSSQITTNNMNDATRTILTGNNQGMNTYGNTNIQHEESMYYPDNSYKISISSTGDGIYANELMTQQAQNLNVMVPDANLSNIVAVPVMRPKLGRFIIHGYRPNIQYYLRQIETNNIIKNPSAVLKLPSFIEQIKPDQMNINLSDEQLNSYKQYLIQTGLIKLKPYQLIFSEQFRPKLRNLQWMVVPLESNSEYCRQRCGALFARNTLYSTIKDNASKLPLKLLVPVLKIRSGLKKTVTGVQTVAGGFGDISGGMYRMMKDTPSHVAGLVKENADADKNEN